MNTLLALLFLLVLSSIHSRRQWLRCRVLGQLLSLGAHCPKSQEPCDCKTRHGPGKRWAVKTRGFGGKTACEHTLDCCHDYSQACPVIPCVVSQWSAWSGCAEPCKTTYRVRRRHVIQEPRNGGETCPALEERAGCVEYWTEQGTECKHKFSGNRICYLIAWETHPSLTLDGYFGCRYCVEFQLVAITQGCLHSHHSYTHWMQYLREGHTVCVECQHPALDSESLHCYGDGSGSQRNQLLHWQAVGNPRCSGTWKRIRQLDACSCPSVHSFLFI
uniref:SMB domain-containing protein n=1 Tax=Meleagris gallopavo TaxID=9103 RepID=A0A803YJ62_MELGA